MRIMPPSGSRRIDNALDDTHEYLNLFLTPRLTIEAAEIASLSSDDWSPWDGDGEWGESDAFIIPIN